MKRDYYSDAIDAFLTTSSTEILGQLAKDNDFALEQTQRDAWLEEVNILQSVLLPFHGAIYFEYSIPRMGQRIDVVLLIGPVIFVLEFKVGEKEFTSQALDQVCDYALDLKNFHQTSHEPCIAPILIATKANKASPIVSATPQLDRLLLPIKTSVSMLGDVIELGI